ncbi:MAG TPA: hypothetical protein PK156_35280 [Polyangium sp.]|nr:hypothetical protein [Polyangium sp.]
MDNVFVNNGFRTHCSTLRLWWCLRGEGDISRCERNGFYKEAIGFLPFFPRGFKDNPHLERAVMTGIV